MHMTNSVVNDKIQTFSPSAASMDSWGKSLSYRMDRQSITIISAGADSIMGTDDDICGVLMLSDNLNIQISGRYRKTVFRHGLYSSHEGNLMIDRHLHQKN
jgi:hypothetical protein